jgi:hypothetical protein
MIEALYEVSEIPFDVFWDKYIETIPGDYDKEFTKGIWLKMREENRLLAFGYLSRFGTNYKTPVLHLEAFDIPF